MKIKEFCKEYSNRIDKLKGDYLKENLDCISFKIECPKDTQNPGGINIFGENFGNFNQNIKVKCYYK